MISHDDTSTRRETYLKNASYAASVFLLMRQYITGTAWKRENSKFLLGKAIKNDTITYMTECHCHDGNQLGRTNHSGCGCKSTVNKYFGSISHKFLDESPIIHDDVLAPIRINKFITNHLIVIICS